MVRLLSRLLASLGRDTLGEILVEEVVGSDHVVDDGRLGDLLGAELGGSRQVESVVVSQVVVGCNSASVQCPACMRGETNKRWTRA